MAFEKYPHPSGGHPSWARAAAVRERERKNALLCLLPACCLPPHDPPSISICPCIYHHPQMSKTRLHTKMLPSQATVPSYCTQLRCPATYIPSQASQLATYSSLYCSHSHAHTHTHAHTHARHHTPTHAIASETFSLAYFTLRYYYYDMVLYVRMHVPAPVPRGHCSAFVLLNYLNDVVFPPTCTGH